MKLSINLFTTFDGVTQSPGSPEEDTRGGFTRGGWLMPVFDNGCGAEVGHWFDQSAALLLGRNTFDTFASHWPHVTDPEDRVAAKINNGPKYVVTSRPLSDTWAETTTALGDGFLEEIRDLKDNGDGPELQVHGSVQLARTLHGAGLVDIYRFLVAPVVVGAGAGIFRPEGPAFTMDVKRGAVTDSGVISLEMTPGVFRTLTTTVEDGKDVVEVV